VRYQSFHILPPPTQPGWDPNKGTKEARFDSLCKFKIERVYCNSLRFKGVSDDIDRQKLRAAKVLSFNALMLT